MHPDPSTGGRRPDPETTVPAAGESDCLVAGADRDPHEPADARLSIDESVVQENAAGDPLGGSIGDLGTAIAVPRIGSGERSEPPLLSAASESRLGPPEPLSAEPLSAEPESLPRRAETRGGGHRHRPRGQDPIVQSLTLLVTMALMLAAARFAVPGIVEEIRYAWLRGELRAEYETGTEGLRNVSLDTLSNAYQMVTAVVGPSVVHIDVQRRPRIGDLDLTALRSGSLPASDQGSGVIVDQAGYVLTNRHVVADGEDITVALSDGRRIAGVIVGTDALTDLAVLKIDADRLTAIPWGDSDGCRVGSPVWAVGSPFGLDRTVTFGILSGKHRKVRASTQYQDFMQSDVAVNPGNSGGPLVDARGTLIGINTAIVGDTYQGVSFSIPSNVARRIYERIVETGYVERGWLGVELGEVPQDRVIGDDPLLRGALVTRVTEEACPAALAGMRSGDLIVKVDGKPIRDIAHLMQMVAGSLSGALVKFDVYRDHRPLEMQVRLGSMPARYNLQ